LDPQTLGRPYLQRKRVESIVASHLTGRGNFTSEITRLLTIELTQREMIESN
jgi:hypothetical protein